MVGLPRWVLLTSLLPLLDWGPSQGGLSPLTFVFLVPGTWFSLSCVCFLDNLEDSWTDPH